jgi:hypothetical protein
MSAKEQIERIRLKVERAKKHVQELHAIHGRFVQTNPVRVGPYRQPDRRLAYAVCEIDPIPIEMSLVTGDILHNLRCALDHLARQLVMIGPRPDPNTEFNFPIHNKVGDHKACLKAIKKQVRSDAIDAFAAIEAYRGGKGHDIWILNRLNNVDKHRVIVTVGAATRAINVGAIMTEMMVKADERAAKIVAANPNALDLWMRPADKQCPLKVGDVIFTDLPDAEPNEKLQFRFEIAFHEPQIIEDKPLIETVHHLVDLVSSTIDAFEPCLQ